MTKAAARQTSLPEQPFQRPMPVAKLKRDAETAFRIAAEPDELAALAPYLGVDGVERLSLSGFVSPQGRDGWRVRGRMVAKIVQTCVITLEPLRTRIEEDVERSYVPADQAPRQADVLLLPDEEDTPDPYTDAIDPASLAVESLLLSIDPYPRSEGAALDKALLGGESGGGESTDTRKPFSGLADLMRRRGADEG